VLFRINRYKERVRSSISQKRSASEKKRLSLLEAEKRWAHARVMRARRVMEQQLKRETPKGIFSAISLLL
jgi:hypothetical protein